VSAVWNSILSGLPVLIVDLGVTTVLLLCGIALYVSIAPYHELRLVRQGNVAAAIVLAGQSLALAIPLAAMMANSVNVPDILVWGVVTIILQFVAIVAARLVIPHLPSLIAKGEIAPALLLASGQIIAGLLNAAAMN
jgi:putative membrane protein